MNLSLPKTYFKFLFIAMLFIGQFVVGQVSITTSPYSQNFTIGTSATASLPSGFKFGNNTADWTAAGNATATGAAAGTSGSGALTGSSSGSYYNFANGITASSTDRAIGVLTTGTFSSPRDILFAFTNNTGETVTSLDLTFDYEKYRTGTRAWDMTFFHGSTATNINTAATAGNQTYAADGANAVVNPPTTISKTVSLTGLSISNGTTYYFRWRFTGNGGSTNSQGIGIDNISLTLTSTPSIVTPTVTTTAVSSITTSSASSGGDVTTDGGASVTNRGVAFGTASNPATGTSDGTGTGTFTSSLTSLSLNTQYFYRAYATNSEGTSYGSELSFFTLAATPGVVVVNNPQFTTLDIEIDATTENGNPSATEYAIQETGGGQYVQANGSLGATAVWQTAATWSTTAVTGLTVSTTYTFQVKARNGANVETAFGATNSGTTSTPITADYNVVQFPNTTQNITEGTSLTVYIRAYEDGITNFAGSSPRLKGWVGYSSTNDNPANAGWTWIPTTFNVQVGNDDEYQADIPGTLSPGTYYYAARFEIDDSTVYTYGGAGGNWNNDSVTLNVNADVVDFANIQFPTTVTITEGETVTVFAQVYEPGVTEGAGQGAGITAEIGYSSTDTTPDGTWTWLSATHNATVTGNNDEYQVNLGTGLSAGTYYYASRFIKTGSSTYVYGGTAGIWNNDSGVLTIEALGTPVATEASAIGLTSFTANWDAVDGATSYEIDVYEQSTVFATDLFISEYVEGSSNNKYIEIFNGTGADVDLGDYDLVGYFNGNLTITGPLALSGILANGDTYVIRNSSATIWGGTEDLSNNTVLGFNGNDAIVLRYLGTNIDVVGTIGDSANFAIDITLTRNSNVSSPTTTYNSAEWTTSAQNTVTDLGSHTFAGGSSTTYVIEDVNVGNVTSYEVTGLNLETTYFYVVRAVLGANISANSNEIEVTTLSGTCTWNGTAWSNGTGPTFEIDAILEGAYDTSAEGGFTAKSLTVSTGGSLTIGADTSVTVVNELNNELTAAAVVVTSNGSLIQEGTTNNNSGNVTVLRNSQDLMRLDYTMWSSPVAAQNLGGFSPLTMTNRFYTYNTATDVYATTANTNDFSVGQGYLIRTPDNHPTAPTAWLGQFVGLPNSGDLTVGLSTAGNGYNLVGNPYPSPISISTLLSQNNGVIGGNLYFWRKTNGATGSAYVTYSGGTFSDGPHDFNNIQPGQGFIVEAVSGAGLSFTNTQRQADNGVFYRNANATQSEGNSRIWLNVSANNAVVGQMAIGYNDTASNDIDASDAAYINDNAVALNSFVANTELAVQHRAAFEATDVVPLSFKTNTAGSYTIAINTVDGLFTNEEQSIFLKDNLLAIEHDLRSSSYNFTTEAGSFTNRFEIVYESTLSVITPDVLSQTIVFVKDAMLNVQTSSAVLSGVQVFDVQGRLVLDVKNINSATFTTSLNQISNGVLVVKVITEDGIITTKKIIK